MQNDRAQATGGWYNMLWPWSQKGEAMKRIGLLLVLTICVGCGTSHFRKGEALYARQEWREAAWEFEEAVKQSERAPEAQYYLAKIRARQGHWLEAAEILAQARQACLLQVRALKQDFDSLQAKSIQPRYDIEKTLHGPMSRSEGPPGEGLSQRSMALLRLRTQIERLERLAEEMQKAMVQVAQKKWQP